MNQKCAESTLDRTSFGHNPQLKDCHVDRHPSDPNQSRIAPRWTDSEVDRTKIEQNPDLTEPAVDTILCKKNVMWPDYQVERFQEDKNPGEQTPK